MGNDYADGGMDLGGSGDIDMTGWYDETPDEVIIVGGTYDAICSKVEAKESRNGNKPMLNITFDLQNHPKYNGQKMWLNVLINPNMEEKPFAKTMIKKRLTQLAKAFGQEDLLAQRKLRYTEWVGNAVRLVVKLGSYNGEPKGEITAVLPANETLASVDDYAAAVTPQPAAPLPVAAPRPVNPAAVGARPVNNTSPAARPPSLPAPPPRAAAAPPLPPAPAPRTPARKPAAPVAPVAPVPSDDPFADEQPEDL